jgi:hypothetical protein
MFVLVVPLLLTLLFTPFEFEWMPLSDGDVVKDPLVKLLTFGFDDKPII